jgi:type II pantothenate kinase
VTRVGGTALGRRDDPRARRGAVRRARLRRDRGARARGDRRRVDLLVRDIYPAGDFLLPGDLNAASFAKLAHAALRPAAADLAHGIMGLVGENVGLICAGLAARADAQLSHSAARRCATTGALTAILGGVCAALGRRPHLLADGQYVGAVGALALAEQTSGCR